MKYQTIADNKKQGYSCLRFKSLFNYDQMVGKKMTIKEKEKNGKIDRIFLLFYNVANYVLDILDSQPIVIVTTTVNPKNKINWPKRMCLLS